jgi:hypothetical protein
MYESVSLFVVAAVKDTTLESGAVTDELRRCLLLWLVSATATATSLTTTATGL